MKKISILIVFIAGIMSLTSCLKDDYENNYPTTASVWITNLHQIESGLVYLVGGRQINDLNGGRYRSLTYFNAFPGNRNIKVLNGLSSEVLVDTTMTFSDSLSYSNFIYGQAGKPLFVRSVDVGLKDLDSKAGVRFFHLADGVDKVNLFIGDQEIEAFQNKSQETSTTMAKTEIFQKSDNGTYTLTAKDAAGNVLVTKENVELRAGKYHNIILLGTKGSTRFPLDLGVSNY